MDFLRMWQRNMFVDEFSVCPVDNEERCDQVENIEVPEK
jgi:hypothetical protein